MVSIIFGNATAAYMGQLKLMMTVRFLFRGLACAVYEMLKMAPPFADLGVFGVIMILNASTTDGSYPNHTRLIEGEATFPESAKVGTSYCSYKCITYGYIIP